MKHIKFSIIFLLLLAFAPARIYSQPYDVLFTWTTLETFGLYDLTNGRFVQSFDINASYMFVNGGISYKNIKHIDAKKISYYAGLGFGSFIQFQAGYSGDGFSIRNRYDFPPAIFFDFCNIWNPPDWLYQITVSPSIEKYFGNDNMNWYFGFGIGFSINNMVGFIH